MKTLSKGLLQDNAQVDVQLKCFGAALSEPRPKPYLDTVEWP